MNISKEFIPTMDNYTQFGYTKKDDGIVVNKGSKKLVLEGADALEWLDTYWNAKNADMESKDNFSHTNFATIKMDDHYDIDELKVGDILEVKQNNSRVPDKYLLLYIENDEKSVNYYFKSDSSSPSGSGAYVIKHIWDPKWGKCSLKEFTDNMSLYKITNWPEEAIKEYNKSNFSNRKDLNFSKSKPVDQLDLDKSGMINDINIAITDLVGNDVWFVDRIRRSTNTDNDVWYIDASNDNGKKHKMFQMVSGEHNTIEEVESDETNESLEIIYISGESNFSVRPPIRFR